MKHINRRYLLFIFLAIFAIYRIFWLCSAIVFIMLMYWSINYVLKQIKINFIKKLCKGLFSILILFFVVICIRVFIVDIYLIPSLSMANTLYPKDVILVNKLIYGPNLPQSPYEIPLVNIFYFLKADSKNEFNYKVWQSKRLQGTSVIKQGDIVVFKKNEIRVKRCVAIAGDTLKMINGKIYTNNKLFKPSGKVKKDKANYSQIVLPKKGMQIPLTVESFKLYRSLLIMYENVDIQDQNNNFYKNGKLIKNYVFERNYYFMLGDNRKDSRDSRNFGLIPEEDILGKVSCVLFSNKDGHFQWSRFLKGI